MESPFFALSFLSIDSNFKWGGNGDYEFSRPNSGKTLRE